MLFPLETSIPTAFIGYAPVNRFAMEKATFSHYRFHLFADASASVSRGSTCTNRTPQMRGWLTDYPADVIALGYTGQTTALSFYSLGMGYGKPPLVAMVPRANI
jgi:hypothetical protein